MYTLVHGSCDRQRWREQLIKYPRRKAVAGQSVQATDFQQSVAAPAKSVIATKLLRVGRLF